MLGHLGIPHVSVVKNRREFKFDKVSFDTMDYLLIRGMITRMPNGDLDYSGIGTTEVIAERQELGKGQENWEQVLNFPVTKRMVDAGVLVFENNIIYKVYTYPIKIEELKRFDDDKKRLFDIAPELVTYPMDLYIAQKIS